MPVQKIGGCAEDLQPRPVQEKIVDLIGQNELFKFDLSCPQALDQIHSLGEAHRRVIVSMGEKYRGFPQVHRGHWRGLASTF